MNKAQIKINHEAELNRDNFIIHREEFERADKSGKETVAFELVDSLRFLHDGQDMIFRNKKTGRFRIGERGGHQEMMKNWFIKEREDSLKKKEILSIRLLKSGVCYLRNFICLLKKNKRAEKY